jgi:fucose permease
MTGRYKVFVVVGTGITVIGIALLTQITVSTGDWVLSGMLFVVGVGVGMFMQTLVLAIQNSIAQSDMGVGTSAVTFARTLGGAIGASSLGAILIDQERTKATADAVRYGVKAGAQHAFTHGMDQAFLWALPFAALSFAMSPLLKEVRLRKTLGSVTSATAPEPAI